MLRVLAVSLLLAGCSVLQQTGLLLVGEGDVTTEARPVNSFDSVEFNGGVRFVLTVGQPTSVTVAAQPNLLPITVTEVVGGKLTVRTTRPYSTSQGITVTVTTPALTAVTVNGGVAGDVNAIATSDFAADANGGANLTLIGTCTTLRLSANGGATVDGTGLAATDAAVNVNGGAQATITVSGRVAGSANGGATLNLLGNPASVNVTTSGGASVHQ
jgi:Putative auto-transporter adhesin, head GIN domain